MSSALARSRITPNQISVASMFFAGAGASVLAWAFSAPALLLCALCIQGRLVCNLIDGMVAVEGGKHTPTGALYNEFPDRVADSLLLVALGCACGQPWLGWLGALIEGHGGFLDRLDSVAFAAPVFFHVARYGFQ